MNATLAIVAAAVLVWIAGLLATADAALSTFSRARAAELATEGRAGAVRLERLLADPPRFVNSILLVRIVTETAGAVLVALVVARTLDPWWLQVLVATAVMAVVNFVAIGVGPRTVGRQHAELVALVSALPVQALEWLLGPIPYLLILLGNALTPGRGFRQGPFASEAEVRELVDLAAASDVIETSESRMIQSVFELGDTLVREVMVPRTDIVFIEGDKTLRQAMSLALRSGFSRLPVVADNLDDVVAMAYLKDLTKRVFDNRDAEKRELVESISRPCFFVPDTAKAADLLRTMQANRLHVAIVVDEYGGTAGMVTIEDVLEEIVGEITDEYDSEPDAPEQLADGSWRVSARYGIDDLDELVGVRVEEDDVDSVGGLLAKALGRVPIPGSEVEVAGLQLTAEGAAGRRNRIGRVRVRRIEPEES